MVSQNKKAKTQSKKREQRLRNWVVTSFDIKMFKAWKKLDCVDMRYFVYQLEMCPTTNRLHIQGYVELYKALNMSQLKTLLGDNTVHCEKRKGTRVQARDYCMKDDGAYFTAKYPDWSKHGGRIPGSEPVEIGTWAKKPGLRTDLLKVADMVAAGASELEILEECPRQYLKYSGHIAKARALYARKEMNKWHDIKVNVLWGQAGAGKTRHVYDTHGPENVYTPVWNGSKWWFDGYTGQKVLLINEFYGQCRTSVMQQLLDKYRMQVEYKGGTTVSAWDTIYITSNCHPREWYNSWESVPQKVQQSFIRRIATIKYLEAPAAVNNLTWESREVGGPSTTPPTSVHKVRSRSRAQRKRRKRKKQGKKSSVHPVHTVRRADEKWANTVFGTFDEHVSAPQPTDGSRNPFGFNHL